MKTKILTLLFVFALSFSSVLAHPPHKPDISYDKESGKLTISFNHPVKNVDKHYLDKVCIFIDGDEYKLIEYDEQTNLEGHQIVLDIDNLDKGTKIKVKASCNKMGKKSGKYIVE